MLGNTGGYPVDNGCKISGYDGNGIFDLGQGIWQWPFNITLDNNNVTIRGQGQSETTLIYTGDNHIWIQCSENCRISLQDLTVTYDVAYDDEFYLFNVSDRGHLYLTHRPKLRGKKREISVLLH